jgi:hypothetical protein
VLLKPRELKPLLEAIHQAAEGAGADERTLAELDAMVAAAEGRAGDYFTFGFDPWTG